MQYKDIKDTRPYNKTRMLRRLWQVEVYDGDKDDADCPVIKETVIAWNQVDATRKSPGELAKLPESLGWVTWPRQGEGHVYLIENTTDGPIEEEEVIPSVGGIEDEDDWDF